MTLFQKFLLSAAGVFIGILSLEFVLLFFPVSEGLSALPVNEANPILKYTPNKTSIWSHGPLMRNVQSVRVNNDGFTNAIDYKKNDSKPLIAIIGDSYVEASMVDQDTRVDAVLRQHLGDSHRVYTFASSGSPLSQYLAYAKYAHEYYQPTKLIVLIVGNDFDESMYSNQSRPGTHYFESQKSCKLIRKDHSISLARKIVRRSRLARYLAINLRAQRFLSQSIFQDSKSARKRFEGNTSVEAPPERVRKGTFAIDCFLSSLTEMAGLPPESIWLAIDAARPAIYSTQESLDSKSYFSTMRNYLLSEAPKYNFQTLDLQPIFKAHYLNHMEPFEFPYDGHWNALGHRLFAKSVLHELKLNPLATDFGKYNKTLNFTGQDNIQESN